MNLNRLCLPALTAASLGLFACNGAPPEPRAASKAAALKPAASSHLLLVVETAPEGLRIVSSREVEGPAPRTRSDHPESWRAQLVDDTGATVASVPVQDPTELRAEWVDESGNLTGTKVVAERTSFVVRVPNVQAAAKLKVTAPGAAGGKGRDVGTARLPERAR